MLQMLGLPCTVVDRMLLVHFFGYFLSVLPFCPGDQVSQDFRKVFMTCFIELVFEGNLFGCSAGSHQQPDEVLHWTLLSRESVRL